MLPITSTMEDYLGNGTWLRGTVSKIRSRKRNIGAIDDSIYGSHLEYEFQLQNYNGDSVGNPISGTTRFASSGGQDSPDFNRKMYRNTWKNSGGRDYTQGR